jgi:kanamycin kinase
MKKTQLRKIPDFLPDDIRRFIGGAPLFDSSCSPEAKVYFIDKDCGYYLKQAAKGSLEREAVMNAYFHSKLLAPEVLKYTTEDGRDWLLSAAARGEDLTCAEYLNDPKRLAIRYGEILRNLHETDYTGCPVMNRTEEYLAFADKNYLNGTYDKDAFTPDSFGYRSAEEAYCVLAEGRKYLKSDTLIHGDYCLPNVMLDGWKNPTFIDLGNGGVSDRHVDLFWGVWTLFFNLKTNDYRDLFLDAYGRDKIDTRLLRVIAAAEVFG